MVVPPDHQDWSFEDHLKSTYAQWSAYPLDKQPKLVLHIGEDSV